ncbi:endonuclease V [Plastoroseomonas arctica]|uniref:Endonuclease V n=1 Tax=Plastoroseomonas arctica TaxID=1509237 RepID=A0AAF1JWT1_9PROT|nr:endonuclease V [Plastoroseomonas arctica]MBR0655552.1 endonuclease V [Plastoroseomonas arctica]
MAERVETADRLLDITTLGGADVSASRFDPTRRVWAALVTLDAATLTPIETTTESCLARFPYIPGYLGFREAPALLAAWHRLAQKPDLLFVDGQGIAHPRRMGIASHLGVLLDIPTIGVAKSRLVGEVQGERVMLHGEAVAALITLRPRANPLHISPGHRISLDTAIAWVRRTATGHRLPAPTRAAHIAAGALRRGELDRAAPEAP